MFASDKPIGKLEDDKLNRKSFSEYLAKAILSYVNQDNFTISLCGKWGSGKTSIINMVIDSIQKMAPKDNIPLIVKYNPWNYSEKNQLIGQFFNTILSAIGSSPDGKNLKKVGDALEKYSGLMEYTQFIPVVGKFFVPLKSALSVLGKNFTEIGKSKESIDNLKNNVVEELRKQNQRIIIIIDDIDRLNNEQIRLIFQLVNCVAGFPNMIYILSFDKDVVARALEEEQKCNGEEYLEKIIQVPFDIPEAKISDVQQIFFEYLDDILFNETPCDNFDKEYWGSVFRNCIAPYICTIRDVNRIINVFRFKYGLLHNETNCIDLLAITTLQICAPPLYEWIKNNIGRLTGSFYGIGISGVDQKKNKEEYINELSAITNNPQSALCAIQSIFPKLSWNTGFYYGTCETEDELRRKQKVACSERAPLFFSLSLDDVKVAKELIVESINNYDENSLDELCAQLIKSDNIVQYLKELKSYCKDIPDDRLQLFIRKMLTWQTLSLMNESTGQLFFTPTAYCNDCCWELFGKIGKVSTRSTIESLVSELDENTFLVLVEMIVSIEEAYNRIEGSVYRDYRIVSEDDLELLEDKILDRLKTITESKFLLSLGNYWGARRFLLYKDKELLEKHIKEQIKDSCNIPYYLYANANVWSSGGSHGWDFDEKVLSNYIEINDLYNSVLSLKGTPCFSNLDIKTQKVVVAFYLWHNYDGEKDNVISEEKVDNELPMWIKCKE